MLNLHEDKKNTFIEQFRMMRRLGFKIISRREENNDFWYINLALFILSSNQKEFEENLSKLNLEELKNYTKIDGLEKMFEVEFATFHPKIVKSVSTTYSLKEVVKFAIELKQNIKAQG